jgi:hypothetical protein
MSFSWWLKYTWKVLCTPNSWMRVGKYNAEWDAQLLVLLRMFKFESVCRSHASINGIELWITTHPWSSFHTQEAMDNAKSAPELPLPSRKTALYAMDLLREQQK